MKLVLASQFEWHVMAAAKALLAGLLCVHLATATALAVQFTAEGYLEGRFVNSSETRLPDQARRFRLSRNGAAWRIDTIGTHPLNAAASDGHELYEIYAFAGSDRASGAVAEADSPHILEWDKLLIWFCFTGTELLRNGGSVPPPWGSVFRDVLVNACEPKLTWPTAPSVAPAEAEFVYSARTLERNLHRLELLELGPTLQEREEQIDKIRRDYEDGFIVGRFRVTEWQQMESMMIPTQWLLQRFRPGVGLVYEIEGQILDLLPHAGTTELVPSPGIPLRVTDYRFRNVKLGVNAARYTLTNSAWLPRTAAELRTAAHQPPPATLYLRHPDLSSHRGLSVALLLFTFLVPAIIFAAYKLYMNHNTRKDNL